MSGTKSNFNNQFGLISADGAADVPADVAPLAVGDGTYMLLDRFGRPYINARIVSGGFSGGEVQPVPPTAAGPTTACIAGRLIGSAGTTFAIGAANLYWLSAMNDMAGARYLQVFNTIVAPTDGVTVPFWSWRMPQSGDHVPLQLAFGTYGVFFSNGITVWVSSDLEVYDATNVDPANHTMAIAFDGQ